MTRALLCIAALATVRCSAKCEVCDGVPPGAVTTQACTFGSTDVTITPVGAGGVTLAFDGTANVTTTAPLTIAADSFSLVVTPSDAAQNFSIGDDVTLSVAGACPSGCNIVITVRDSVSDDLLLAAWDTNSDDGLTVDDWQVSYAPQDCTGVTQSCGVAVGQTLAVTQDGQDVSVPAGDRSALLTTTVLNGQSLIYASTTCSDVDETHFAGAIIPSI